MISVHVGVAYSDLKSAWSQIGTSLVVDLIFMGMSKFIPKQVENYVGKRGKEIIEDLFGKVTKGPIKNEAQEGVENLFPPGGTRGALNSATGGAKNLHTDNPTKPEEGAPTANDGISQTSDGGFEVKEDGSDLTAAESSPSAGSSFGEALP